MIIVTGTGGIGYETALALARAGAEVILAGRNRSKGESALKKIRSNVTTANIHFEELDLADLASIEAFTERMRIKYQRLDVLATVSPLVKDMNTAKRLWETSKQLTNVDFDMTAST